MKILFLDWNSFGNEDLIYWFRKLDFDVTVFPFDQKGNIRDITPATESLLLKIKNIHYDFVFSFNYFPVVSTVCFEAETKYVSWVYDCPCVALFSKTLSNPCNYVFLFDSHTYQAFKKQGISTVYYLPLAANPKRLKQLYQSSYTAKKYKADIAFVGSTYKNDSHNLFSHIQNLSDYENGYLNSILQIQEQLYGMFLLEELLTPSLLKELRDKVPYSTSKDGTEQDTWIYANYYLAYQVTANERMHLLEALSNQFQVSWYTHEVFSTTSNLMNKSPLEYYAEMPYAFRNAKINLNISLKAIQSGIPLRIFDILGCGGFAITNYQEDLFSCFEPGKDLIYYESPEDLIEKCNYYLTHEQERLAIAGHGFETLCNNHTFPHRIQTILATIDY